MTMRGEGDMSRPWCRLSGPALGGIVGILSCVGLTATVSHAGSPTAGHDHSAGLQANPAWAEQLKGQTIVEDVMEGHPERTAMMERQHQRVMDQMQKDAEAQRTGGSFNDVNMMHQYGAGGQDILLMSQPGGDPVPNLGGRCPASASVKPGYHLSHCPNFRGPLSPWSSATSVPVTISMEVI